MTKHLRSFRFVLVAAGLTVAAPVFASAATPLCGDEKGSQDDNKSKSDSKTKENPPKKPANPS